MAFGKTNFYKQRRSNLDGQPLVEEIHAWRIMLEAQDVGVMGIRRLSRAEFADSSVWKVIAPVWEIGGCWLSPDVRHLGFYECLLDYRLEYLRALKSVESRVLIAVRGNDNDSSWPEFTRATWKKIEPYVHGEATGVFVTLQKKGWQMVGVDPMDHGPIFRKDLREI